jgi:hypothetical protein
LAPGDVLAIATPASPFTDAIHAAAALQGETTLVDHIAAVHHIDSGGRWWGIEGRPGGVGWVDLARYDGAIVASNAAQPKTEYQRRIICQAGEAMLGTPYDWGAVVFDAAVALHLDGLYKLPDWGPQAPAHVVCSSMWAWAYRERAGLAEPNKPMVTTTPADWWEFLHAQGWA